MSSGYAWGKPLRFFDIVNGFLIDAVAHRAQHGGRKLSDVSAYAALTIVELGESQVWQMLNLAEH